MKTQRNIALVILTFAIGATSFAAPPTISSLSPTSGPIATSVTINGSNFGSTQGTSTLKFNGTTVTPTSWSATKIVAPVPVGATTGSVIVTVSNKASNGVTFTVTPSIASLSSSSGAVGASVTITGNTFGATQGTSTVKFNGTTGSPSSWSATQIVVPVPAGATSGTVVVTVGGNASNGINFTVLPSITAVSPNSAAVGFPITIMGYTFGATQGTSTVKFNGVTATPTSWSSTQIQVPLPAGSTAGNVVVTVAGYDSNAVPFAVVAPGYLAGRLEMTAFSYSPDYPQINLSDPEVLDWVHWALSGASSVDRKSGANLIRSLTIVGPDAPTRYTSCADHFTWTNGDVNTNVSDACSGLYLASVGDGFQITVPADSTPKTLKLYVATDHGNGRLQAGLTDNSAVPYTDSSLLTGGDAGGTYSIDFQAASPGQTLTVLYTLTAGSDVTIEAAELIPKHPDVAITQPAAGQSFTAPASLTTNVQASQIGATIGSVSLLQDGNSLLTLNNPPFAFQLSNLAAGNYEFSASAADANGLVKTSSPETLHVVGSGGELAASVSTPPSTVDLTQQGTADWVLYGRQGFGVENPVNLDRKGNVAPLIAAASRINWGFWYPYGDNLVTYTAEDGTQSFGPQTTGIYSPNPASGFEFTINAGPNERTANIYLGAYRAQGKFEAYLSDGSAPVFVDTSTDTQDHMNQLYTLRYHAASDCQKLFVRYTLVNNYNYGNVTLQAITADGTPLDPPLLSSLSPATGAAGTTVRIQGCRFGASQGTSTVTFNGMPASVTSWSDSEVDVLVPGGATTGPVVVSVAGLMSNSSSFQVLDALRIVPSATVLTIGQAQQLQLVDSSGNSITGASWSIDNSQLATLSNNDPPQVTAVASGAVNVSATVGGNTFTSLIQISPPAYVPAPYSIADSTGDNSQATTAQVTDSASNVSSYSSFSVGSRSAISGIIGSGCSSCGGRGNHSYTYDVSGNKTSETDELGHVTNYTYDSEGNVVSVSRQLDANTSQTWQYTYNSLGEVLTATDPLGNTTINAYDSQGNLLTVTTPNPDASTPASVTQFGYNSLGELTSITDPLNHVTTLTYTPAGLMSTITDTQNHVTTFEYDAAGNRTAITDALQHRTAFTYDLMSRLTGITYPDHSTISLGYDSRGRKTSITDGNNNVTGYTYDDADRMTVVTDAANNTTQYGYDNENNLISITDALNRVTSFTYDNMGRVKQTLFPSQLAESYTYDSAGNLLTKTDRNNHTITYSYDNLNRMYQKQYPDSTTVNYTYDLAGRLTQVSDSTGTYGFNHDNMGRLTGTTTEYSFLSGQTFTNSYSYDAASNRVGFTAPDGSTNTYGYDNLNRLTTLTNSLTGQFGFSYDELGRRTSLNRPNGINTSYGYDSVSRLLSVLHKAGTTTIDGASYTYDNAGNRISKLNYLNGVTENYTYDPLYQLKQVQQLVSGGQTTTESYTYDAVGNRLSSLNVASYSYNSSNESTSSADGYSYTYDNNGNTLTKSNSSGTTQYAWDLENRLTSLTLPNGGGVVSYRYDPFGRRVQKSSPSSTTNYLYDGENAIEELDQSGSVLARYAQELRTDGLLSTSRAGSSSFYEQDGVNSVTSISNAAAALAQTYTFNAFGTLTAASGSLANPYQYTGREFDSEAGLLNLRARYYDSTTGRFLSEDPLAFSAGVNFYGYAMGNPVRFTDPLGMDVTVSYYPGVGGNPFGHIGISVNGGPVYGFDPSNDFYGALSLLSLIPGSGVVVPGAVQIVPSSRHPSDSVTISTTPEQDAEIQQFIDNVKSNPGGYSLSGRQCTSFVKAALDAGSEKPGEKVLAPFVPLDPRDLIYQLHKTYPTPH